jgi:hypothetical protein
MWKGFIFAGVQVLHQAVAVFHEQIFNAFTFGLKCIPDDFPVIGIIVYDNYDLLLLHAVPLW